MAAAIVGLVVAMPAMAAPIEREAAPATSGCVSYVRWVITKARSVLYTQAAEIVLLDGGVRLPSLAAEGSGIVVTSPSGASDPNYDEGPERAYDGRVDNKWLTFPTDANSVSTLQIEFPDPVDFDEYQWSTVGAEPERDPVSWRLEVSSDGVEWTVLDTQTDFAVPEGSSATVGPFDVTIASCEPVASALALEVQPSGSTVSGRAFAVQPVVQLVDADGEPFAEAGVVVTAAITSGDGWLGGTLTATTDADGQAEFTDLSITGSGEHVLGFTAPGLDGVGSATILVSAVQTGRDFGGGTSDRARSGPGAHRDAVLALEPWSRGRVR